VEGYARYSTVSQPTSSLDRVGIWNLSNSLLLKHKERYELPWSITIQSIHNCVLLVGIQPVSQGCLVVNTSVCMEDALANWRSTWSEYSTYLLFICVFLAAVVSPIKFTSSRWVLLENLDRLEVDAWTGSYSYDSSIHFLEYRPPREFVEYALVCYCINCLIKFRDVLVLSFASYRCPFMGNYNLDESLFSDRKDRYLALPKSHSNPSLLQHSR